MSKTERVSTDGRTLIYEEPDCLTQHEIDKILSLARSVKRGEFKRLEVEIAYGKKYELFVIGVNRAA